MRSEPARQVDTPEPGYFELRLVRGGPWVAARLTQHDGLWRAEIDGEPKRPHADPTLAENVLLVWHYGRRATEGDYRHRLALRAWALQHAPDHPAANPRKPIDLRTHAPVY